MHSFIRSLAQWKWKDIKLADIFLVLLLIVFISAVTNRISVARQVQQYLQPVTIEIVVPNLDPEVARQIQVADLITDQQGKPCFEIIKKTERSAEHPVIDAEGNIVVAQHPQLVSLFLTIQSLEGMDFGHGIRYNWQIIKIGGSLIWETQYCRFVGLVRAIN